MYKGYIFAFSVFIFFSIIMFFGGILGIIFSLKYYNNIRKLEKSNIIESAIIERVGDKISGSSDTIYFTLINDGKTYRTNLLRPNKIKVGEEIEVRFNDEKTLFLITNYSKLVYAGYIVQIILFIVCFLLSIPMIIGTINIYRRM